MSLYETAAGSVEYNNEKPVPSGSSASPTLSEARPTNPEPCLAVPPEHRRKTTVSHRMSVTQIEDGRGFVQQAALPPTSGSKPLQIDVDLEILSTAIFSHLTLGFKK
jgi:hypothetical protein